MGGELCFDSLEVTRGFAQYQQKSSLLESLPLQASASSRLEPGAGCLLLKWQLLGVAMNGFSFFLRFILRECLCARTGEEQRERERENPKQPPLSTQSPMWGLNHKL